MNSASYRVNLDAMRACLEAGCHYIDLGGLYWLTGRAARAGTTSSSAAGLLALLGMGSSPGQDERDGACGRCAELGAAPERIDVIAAGRDLDPPDGPSYPYALRTLVDELTMPPMALRDGEPVELEPLQDGGAVRLPRADRRGRDDLHAALRGAHVRATASAARECSFRLSLAPAVLERVRELVGAPTRRSRRPRPRRVPAVRQDRVGARGRGRAATARR